MAITEPFQDSATITTSEYWLAADSTTQGGGQSTDGVYQLWLELNNLANGDEFRLRVYESISAAGTIRIAEEWTLGNLQASPLWVCPSLIFMHKWDFSLTKLAGTDRAIAWSIRRVA